MRTISEKLATILVDNFGIDRSEITPESSFAKDFGFDSLGIVDLIQEMEKAFGLTIPDEAAEKIETFGDAVTYLEENLKD